MLVLSKLGSLKDDLRKLFAGSESICLWFSGGADSSLLLEAMLEIEKPFGILRFDDGWSKKQKEILNAIIKKHNLQVFSYPPSHFFLIGNEREISLAAFYAVDSSGQAAAVVRDIVPGERCAFDIKIAAAKMPSAPVEFDAHLVGTRFEDAHYSFAGEPLLKSSRWKVGEKCFYAPLADWTRAEVLAGLKIFGVDYKIPTESEDSGNISCCFSCLKQNETGRVFCPKENKMIPTVKWNPLENLRIFQNLLGSGLRNRSS